jgi:hypothetical protein
LWGNELKLKLAPLILALSSALSADGAPLDQLKTRMVGNELEISWSIPEPAKSVNFVITDTAGSTIQTIKLPCETTPCTGTTALLNLDPGAYVLKGYADDLQSEELVQLFNITSGNSEARDTLKQSVDKSSPESVTPTPSIAGTPPPVETRSGGVADISPPIEAPQHGMSPPSIAGTPPKEESKSAGVANTAPQPTHGGSFATVQSYDPHNTSTAAF